jgi:hypothetical protein
MIIFSYHLVDFLYSLGLEFVALSVGNMSKNISCKTTCQIVYKGICTHFLHLWFFTKMFMHNYICVWKITTTMQMIIIWIIQYFSLIIIPCKLYIWKIAETKSFNFVSRKWYPNREYALVFLHKFICIKKMWNSKIVGWLWIINWMFLYFLLQYEICSKFVWRPCQIVT